MPKRRLKYRTDAKTDSDWDALARTLGVESGAALKEQTRLADQVITELLLEEDAIRGIASFVAWVEKESKEMYTRDVE